MHQKARRQLGRRSITEIRAGGGGGGGRAAAGGGGGGGHGDNEGEDKDNAYADVDGDSEVEEYSEEEEEDCRAFRSLRFRQRYSREGSSCVLPFRFKGTYSTTSTLPLLSRLV
jgi:hypothetical protein